MPTPIDPVLNRRVSVDSRGNRLQRQLFRDLDLGSRKFGFVEFIVYEVHDLPDSPDVLYVGELSYLIYHTPRLMRGREKFSTNQWPPSVDDIKRARVQIALGEH